MLNVTYGLLNRVCVMMKAFKVYNSSVSHCSQVTHNDILCVRVLNTSRNTAWYVACKNQVYHHFHPPSLREL